MIYWLNCYYNRLSVQEELVMKNKLVLSLSLSPFPSHLFSQKENQDSERNNRNMTIKCFPTKLLRELSSEMTLIYGRIIIINNNINSKAFPYNGTHTKNKQRCCKKRSCRVFTREKEEGGTPYTGKYHRWNQKKAQSLQKNTQHKFI